MNETFVAPAICNRQQLIEEIKSVLGSNKLLSVTWGPEDEIALQVTKISTTERAALTAIISRHDGTIRNELDAQTLIAKTQERADRLANKRSLRAKLETGIASLAEIQQALAMVFR